MPGLKDADGKPRTLASAKKNNSKSINNKSCSKRDNNILKNKVSLLAVVDEKSNIFFNF